MITLTIELTPREEAAFTIAASRTNKMNQIMWQSAYGSLPAEQQYPQPTAVTAEQLASNKIHEALTNYAQALAESDLVRVSNVLRSQVDTGEFLANLADIAEQDPALLQSAVSQAMQQANTPPATEPTTPTDPGTSGS